MGAKKSEVYLVTSGKGGVGKTTVTANFGAVMALNGYKTVVVDLDIGLRKLDLILGVENRVVYDIIQVAEGEVPVQKALVKVKSVPNLYLLPAAQTRNKEDITSEQLKQIVNELKEEFDYIFLDCPAGIEGGFRTAASAADKAIIVVNPEVASVRDADRVIGILETYDLKDMKLVVNRLKPNMVENGDMMTIEDILDILFIDLLGSVPDDENVTIANNKGQVAVLNPQSKAGNAFRQLALKLDGMLTREENNAGIFSRLFGSLFGIFKLKKANGGM